MTCSDIVYVSGIVSAVDHSSPICAPFIVNVALCLLNYDVIGLRRNSDIAAPCPS